MIRLSLSAWAIKTTGKDRERASLGDRHKRAARAPLGTPSRRLRSAQSSPAPPRLVGAGLRRARPPEARPLPSEEGWGALSSAGAADGSVPAQGPRAFPAPAGGRSPHIQLRLAPPPCPHSPARIRAGASTGMVLSSHALSVKVIKYDRCMGWKINLSRAALHGLCAAGRPLSQLPLLWIVLAAPGSARKQPHRLPARTQ